MNDSVGKATHSMLKHLEGLSGVSNNFFKRQPVKGHPLILPTCVFWSSSRRFAVVNNRIWKMFVVFLELYSRAYI